MSKILITIADGFHYRYLVDTEIVKSLSNKHDITIMTIPILVDDLKKYRRLNNLSFNVTEYTQKIGKGRSLARNLYKKILLSSSNKLTETVNIKNEINKNSKDKIFNFVTYLLGKSDFIIGKTLNFLGRSFYDRSLNSLLKETQFDLIITSTPGQKEFDLPFLYYSKKHKLRSLSPVYSWDNLTAKGPFYFEPDFLIVWNDIMKNEGIYYHNYSQDRIFSCGVPVFDKYPEVLASKNDNFKVSLGLNDDYPMITITTIPQIYYGSSHLTLALALLNERGKRLPYFNLLLRPHPMDETDYSALRGYENSVVDEYGSKPDKTLVNWRPTSDNVTHLGNTMKYSDVVINMASTITIDAACFNTPIINIFFDLKTSERDYVGSIRRYYNYTHYKHIVDAKACFFSNSLDQLIEHVNLYLNNKHIHEIERKDLVKKQVMFFDGSASMRIVNKIEEIISDQI